MKRSVILAACVLAASLTSGCGPSPTVDSSSRESLQTSMHEVTQSLPDEYRERFLTTILQVEMQAADAARQKPRPLEEVVKQFDGMSTLDVMEWIDNHRNRTVTSRDIQALHQAGIALPAARSAQSHRRSR